MIAKILQLKVFSNNFFISYNRIKFLFYIFILFYLLSILLKKEIRIKKYTLVLNKHKLLLKTIFYIMNFFSSIHINKNIYL